MKSAGGVVVVERQDGAQLEDQVHVVFERGRGTVDGAGRLGGIVTRMDDGFGIVVPHAAG
jgi:hypothetical protein